MLQAVLYSSKSTRATESDRRSRDLFGIPLGMRMRNRNLRNIRPSVTRIIQSLYYSPASRCINAWMHSLKKSVKPEIVNRYDLWILRHKIGGAIKCL
jgi:hypothetical protein